jgi:hypothetical protein
MHWAYNYDKVHLHILSPKSRKGFCQNLVLSLARALFDDFIFGWYRCNVKPTLNEVRIERL